MIVRKTVGTVGTLAHEAVATAVSVARHPIGTTALAAGFVKGAAGAGIDLLRGTVAGSSPTPTTDTPLDAVPAQPLDAEAPADTVAQATATDEQATQTVEDERDRLPGPDLAEFEPPRPEDLPEPIVIEAEDTPATNGESGEPFHNEPKATSRDSEHGAGPIDPVELEEYLEESSSAVDEVKPQP